MNYNKIKDEMNEILRGDTDALTRKYIGRSADGWSRNKKTRLWQRFILLCRINSKEREKPKATLSCVKSR